MNLLDEYKTPLSHLLTAPFFSYSLLKKENSELKKPTIAGHKELIKFCNFTNEAYRTQLSRSKQKQELLIDNSDGIDRIEVSSKWNNLSEYFQKQSNIDEYTLVIFSFPTGESKRRYRLKETLKDIKFTIINPNVYLGWSVNNKQLEELLFKEGYSENIQIITQIKEIPKNSIENIKNNLDINLWNKKTESFTDLYHRFILKHPKGSSTRLFALLSASVSLYNNLLIPSPNLPPSLFAGITLIKDLENEINQSFIIEKEEITTLYKRWFN